jgi:hypothetical protein
LIDQSSAEVTVSALPLSIRIGAAKDEASGPKVTIKLTNEQRLQIMRVLGRTPDQLEVSLEDLNNRAGWRQMNKTE